jgi:hypothetical protein
MPLTFLKLIVLTMSDAPVLLRLLTAGSGSVGGLKKSWSLTLVYKGCVMMLQPWLTIRQLTYLSHQQKIGQVLPPALDGRLKPPPVGTMWTDSKCVVMFWKQLSLQKKMMWRMVKKNMSTHLWGEGMNPRLPLKILQAR